MPDLIALWIIVVLAAIAAMVARACRSSRPATTWTRRQLRDWERAVEAERVRGRRIAADRLQAAGSHQH